MNGKIKTKFAALFAVALMITVCCVPLVDSEGYVEAASTGSSDGVFDGYEITLFTDDSDNYDKMVYNGTLPVALTNAGWTISSTTSTDTTGYWIKDGKYLTWADIPGEEFNVNNAVSNGFFPMVQIVYDYDDANVNNITGKIEIKNSAGTVVNEEAAGDNFSQAGGISGKTQGIYTYFFNNPKNDIYGMRVPVAQQVGTYTVEINVEQGITKQKVTETLDLGPAVTVSGTIYDAGNQPIKSEYDGTTFVSGLRVNYTVGIGSTSDLYTYVDQDGKYEIQVEEGSVVKIKGIASGYIGSGGSFSLDNTSDYTFDSAVWNFGEVNQSVTMDFVAKEYTGSITFTSANGLPIEGATVALAWYYQYSATVSTANGNATQYTIATAPTSDVQGAKLKPGKIVNLSNSDKNGILKFAYYAPSIVEGQTLADYQVALININKASITGDAFTFVTPTGFAAGNTTDASKQLNAQVASINGMIDAQYGQGSFVANESVGTITFTSANGNPISGASVGLQWLYQYSTTSTSASGEPIITYTVAGTTGVNALNAGKVVKLSNSDENGIFKFAYYAPSIKEGQTISDYQVALVNNSNPSAGSYEFTPYSVALTGNHTGASEQLSALIASDSGRIDVQNGSGSFVSTTYSYLISGEVVGLKNKVDNGVIYTIDGADPTTSSSKANVAKGGAFSFYVIKGSEVVIELNGIADYAPSCIALGTVEENKTVKFEKPAANEIFKEVQYYVTGVGTNSVKFTYSINGIEAEATLVGGALISDKAVLKVMAPYGADIEVSATAVNYEIGAFDKYEAKAVLMETVSLYTYIPGEDSTTVPFAGAEVVVKYTVGTNNVVEETYKSDERGIVSYVRPASVDTATYVIDGKIATFNDSTTKPSFTYPGITVNAAQDVSDYYPAAETANVEIKYVSAYNEENAVSKAEVAQGESYATFEGESVALKAPAIQGFKFSAWLVDGVVVSESAEYTLDVTKSVDVQALYAADVPAVAEDNSNAFNINVLIIGLVILVLGILAVAYGIMSKKN